MASESGNDTRVSKRAIGYAQRVCLLAPSRPPFLGEPPERLLRNVIGVVRIPLTEAPEFLDEAGGRIGQLGFQDRERCVRVAPGGIQCSPERAIQKIMFPSPPPPAPARTKSWGQNSDPPDLCCLLRLGGERRGEDHCTRASEERATVHHWALWLPVCEPGATECGTCGDWLTGVANQGKTVDQHAVEKVGDYSRLTRDRSPRRH
jgi:hypothetical protein